MTNFSISSIFDFNSIGPDFIENPFPMCQALREYSPMHRNADGSLFLTRYADVLQVYRDPLMSSDKKITFEKKFGNTPLYEHHTTSLVFNDPPYHTVVRKLLSAGFTPRKLA
ncbi:MAG: cytochrome P450, partial [Rhodospirillaceae bacterium]|nr:cytochrome P450 [Rhodospirillaceae bacterium]